MAELNSEARQLASEVAHWRQAAEALLDLDGLASHEAWASLESYLHVELRSHLQGLVVAQVGELRALEQRLRAGIELARAREALLRERQRYLQLETITDFFGDALLTRSHGPTAALLRGLDHLAVESMQQLLRPLGISTPPALVYLDKGLGASILRAGVRLWGQSLPSPVAAIKVTRHNLGHPTALFHETGHQVAHLTGWKEELAAALKSALAPRSSQLAEVWESWASEVGADVYAFCLAGWAPLPALANVVSGDQSQVFRWFPGDPHPLPWLRVLFNAALCRSWFGAGPWDGLAQSWRRRHDPRAAPQSVQALCLASVEALPTLVEVCTRQPMQSLEGRPISAWLDPRQASPQALAALAQRAGDSLLHSSYLARTAPLQILAHLTSQSHQHPDRSPEHRQALAGWLRSLGGAPQKLTA